LLRSTTASRMKTAALESEESRKRDSPGKTGIEAGPKPGTTPNVPSSNLRASHPPQGNAPWQQPVHNVPNYLVWSILSTILCCPPLGIVSIVYAVQVNQKVAAGDFAGAMASSRNAKTWAIIAAIGGVVGAVIWTLIYGLAFMSQLSSY